jgi:hypothetical protein
MKNILILNDILAENFSLPDFFASEKIAPPNYDDDIDTAINNYLISLNNREINSITLPISLSNNFLELSGIRVGHHIRLTKEFRYRTITLIFYGPLNIDLIARTSPLASILFTPNVHYVNINEYSFAKIADSIKSISQSDVFNFHKYLDYTRIEPPANYQSHHSIANEWALARYYSMLENNNGYESYDRLSIKVSKLDYTKTLHFKYVESKLERQKFKKDHFYTPKFKKISGMTVGIIDDEEYKGWGDFYHYLLEKSGARTEIFQFKKNESKTALVIRLKEWIDANNSSKNPIHIYIVDLRLHDDDFEEKNNEKITGNQIIKYIKTQNKGIQILVSTASNKVWNLQKNIELGVTSFFVKESPETYRTREETRLSMINFTNELDNAAEKSFLATLFEKIELLKNNHIINTNNESDFGNLVFGKNGLLDKIFQLLYLDCFSDAVLNQCLLICFQILENYCDLTSIGSFGHNMTTGQKLSSGFIWKKDTSKFDVFINQPNSKISTWFELKTGKFDFQDDFSNDTIIGYNAFSKMELRSSFQSGIDASSLIKIISVLHFRENIEQCHIERLIKLRYYRSNVSAHLTGKVKSNSKITAEDDILFIIGIFEKVFVRND